MMPVIKRKFYKLLYPADYETNEQERELVASLTLEMPEVAGIGSDLEETFKHLQKNLWREGELIMRDE